MQRLLLASALFGAFAIASNGAAQVTTVPQTGGLPTAQGVPGLLPGAVPFTPQLPPGVSGPNGGISPAQVWMLRGLQNRGGRTGPRTGVPNPIINGGYGGTMDPMMGNAPQQASTGKRKSASEKRAEAKAQKEEKKRAAKTATGKTKPTVKKASKKKSKSNAQ